MVCAIRPQQNHTCVHFFLKYYAEEAVRRVNSTHHPPSLRSTGKANGGGRGEVFYLIRKCDTCFTLKVQLNTYPCQVTTLAPFFGGRSIDNLLSILNLSSKMTPVSERSDSHGRYACNLQLLRHFPFGPLGSFPPTILEVWRTGCCSLDRSTMQLSQRFTYCRRSFPAGRVNKSVGDPPPPTSPKKWTFLDRKKSRTQESI